MRFYSLWGNKDDKKQLIYFQIRWLDKNTHLQFNSLGDEIWSSSVYSITLSETECI